MSGLSGPDSRPRSEWQQFADLVAGFDIPEAASLPNGRKGLNGEAITLPEYVPQGRAFLSVGAGANDNVSDRVRLPRFL